MAGVIVAPVVVCSTVVCGLGLEGGVGFGSLRCGGFACEGGLDGADAGGGFGDGVESGGVEICGEVVDPLAECGIGGSEGGEVGIKAGDLAFEVRVRGRRKGGWLTGKG